MDPNELRSKQELLEGEARQSGRQRQARGRTEGRDRRTEGRGGTDGRRGEEGQTGGGERRDRRTEGRDRRTEGRDRPTEERDRPVSSAQSNSISSLESNYCPTSLTRIGTSFRHEVITPFQPETGFWHQFRGLGASGKERGMNLREIWGGVLDRNDRKAECGNGNEFDGRRLGKGIQN